MLDEKEGGEKAMYSMVGTWIVANEAKLNAQSEPLVSNSIFNKVDFFYRYQMGELISLLSPKCTA